MLKKLLNNNILLNKESHHPLDNHQYLYRLICVMLHILCLLIIVVLYVEGIFIPPNKC